MIIARAALALALTLTGCLEHDYSQTLGLEMDDPELFAAALIAADRVHAASGVYVRVNAPASERAERTVPITWANVAPVSSGRYAPGAGEDGAIVVASDAPGWAVPVVVLHELLHALGAGHTAPGTGILTEAFPGAGALLTSEALEALCAGGAPCAWMRPEAPATFTH